MLRFLLVLGGKIWSMRLQSLGIIWRLYFRKTPPPACSNSGIVGIYEEPNIVTINYPLESLLPGGPLQLYSLVPY